jgi:hypothetical protein
VRKRPHTDRLPLGGAALDPAADSDRLERDVLYMLLDPDFKGPWTVAEIGREINDPVCAKDAVRSLCEVGLAHRSGEIVFASRAAARCFRLMQ